MAPYRRGWIAGGLAGLLAACAPPRLPEAPSPPPAPPPAVIAPAPAPPPEAKTMTLEAYKALVAADLWLRNPGVYSDPVPEMLKSIVVLEITVDRAGNPIGVFVVRSNGYRHLESRALESVVRAAPFPAPSAALLKGAGELTFLETFLFRADESFQLRSLVRTRF